MEHIDRNIELDFNAGQAVQQTTIKLNTDNRGSVRFNIRVLDGEAEINYTSFPTVGIVIHKPDGNNVTEDSNLNPDKLKVTATGITYILHDEAFTSPGNLTMQVDLYTQGTTETIEDGAKKFSTLFFSFRIVASALRTMALSVASGTYLGQLEKLIADGQDKADAIGDILADMEAGAFVSQSDFNSRTSAVDASLNSITNQLNGAALTSLGYTNWNSGNLVVESGLWTPVIYGATTEGTHSYSRQEGFYVRIGSLVHANCFVTLTKDTSMTGAVRLKGFPFAFRAYTAVTFGYVSNMGNNMAVHGYGQGGANFVVLQTYPSLAGGRTDLDSGDIGNAAFMMSATYFKG